MYSYNHKTGEKNIQKVTYVKSITPDKYLEIVAENGIIIYATAEHPLYLDNKKAYVKAGNLSKGDFLVNSKIIYEIINISKVSNHKRELFYDISLSGNDKNYYANGILVHNKGVLENPPLDQRNYKLTIISNSSIIISNNIMLNFIIRNDGIYEYNSMSFWIRFVAGDAGETLDFRWDWDGTNYFKNSNLLNLNFAVDDTNFTNISVINITEIKLIEAELYNFTQSSEEKWIYIFEETNSILYP